jgi:predicted transcriptional regulator
MKIEQERTRIFRVALEQAELIEELQAKIKELLKRGDPLVITQTHIKDAVVYGLGMAKAGKHIPVREVLSDLNRNSTDAMHWAEQLVKTARENNFTLEQVLDEGWLVAWFANYWAAIRDPLQTRIEELEAAPQERIAQLTAHRACGSEEHNPSIGKIHGFCVVCLVPWPCDIAKEPNPFDSDGFLKNV